MIDKPIPGVKTDARPHPAGSKGAKLSGKEVAERAWKARMSPRLRAWVTQELHKAGKSRGTNRDKANVILVAFRKAVPYIADPVMGEFMAEPDQVLCLDEGGLCIIGSDCDEASITIGAAIMSIGIDYMVILASYQEPIDTPSHVYGAFKDELDRWVKLDGTTKHPIGVVAPYRKEWRIEPGAEAKERGEGDFVGMLSVGIAGPVDEQLANFRLRFPMIR